MRILLIMPNFFEYPQIIKTELEQMGHIVDYFDDRPSTSGIVKAIIRVNKNLIHHYIKKYFDNIMEIVSGYTYDVVFVISGQSFSFDEKMVERLKESQPNARYLSLIHI